MKRDKHFYKEKEIIRLKQESREVWESIRNQGSIKLEKPIHHGYHATFVLRADISRRDDAHVYQEALNACNAVIWCKNPDFKFKNRKTKKMERHYPSLKKIHKAEYEKLSLSARKLFSEDTSKEASKYWRLGYNDKIYISNLSFELVTKVTKAYITHRQEHNELLYQKDAEIEKHLYNKTDGNPWRGGDSDYKDWLREQSKREKLNEKRKIIEVKKVYKNAKDKDDLLDI